MDDSGIIDLYWERSEAAIEETQNKYGRYCSYIAYNILSNEQDAEECVNDTYMGAWNAMPPKRPAYLKQFLGGITRNIALNRYDYNKAKKRSNETEIVLDEFWECISDGREPIVDELALKAVVNDFLALLDCGTRVIFMRRYWYMCSIKEIAADMHVTKSNVKIILHRTRNRFKEYLSKEGVLL